MIELVIKLKNKSKKIRFVLCIIAIVCFSIVIVYSGYKIIKWKIDNKETQKQITEFKETPIVEDTTGEEVNPPKKSSKDNDYWNYIKIPLMDVSFGDLLQKNKDTVAWINVNGTNINYPVVQTKNNKYYLNHSFDKQYNAAGWVFADYRNNLNDFDKNTIIYAHGRQDKTMFGSLKGIIKSSWYKDTDNYIVQLSTPNKNTMWQVFSIYKIPTESYYITTKFSNDNEFLKFVDTLQKRSVFDFKATVDENDKILTLSTCYTHTVKVVLHAKLIKTSAR